MCIEEHGKKMGFIFQIYGTSIYGLEIINPLVLDTKVLPWLHIEESIFLTVPIQVASVYPLNAKSGFSDLVGIVSISLTQSAG